jgi:small-conductance mechanosensitive channel
MKIRGHISKMRGEFAIRTAAIFSVFVGTILVGALLFGMSIASAQTPKPPDRQAIINHLNAIISWYHDASSSVQVPGLPSDVVYQDAAQSLAMQALRLAFQSARAESELIQSKNTNGDQAAEPGGQTNYSKIETQVAARIADLQSQIDALNKQLSVATAENRQKQLAQRDALQGQLELQKAMQDAVHKMAGFVETSEVSSQGLDGTINTLAHSVPEILGENANAQPVTKPASAPPKNPETSGLVSEALGLISDLGAMRRIEELDRETLHVRDAADAVRKPLRDNLVTTIQRGNALTSQGTPAPANAAETPADVQKQYQALATDFKQYSNALVPLAQEMVVLDQSRGNLLEWRQSIYGESRAALEALVIHVVGIGIALAVVLLFSQVWRRLTLRYVHDPRRRRQILVLRRFVVGFLIGVVIILGFVSEFSSLATFAGFVTAGIAVGLQTVLLSMAAYFFVIGRYGIRVGDRISISGVTGDVIDIGLVRLYMMELAGPAVDLYPTGRIVVFSNSVLFQATTPLFKQLPGTEYTWHEIVVGLSAGGNHKSVEEKVLAAVNSVYSNYREDIEQQTGHIEGHVEFQLAAPKPEGKLQFGDTGLELVVRYPVELRKASEIDDHMTQTLLDLIDKDAELKSAVAGSPKLRAVVKG